MCSLLTRVVMSVPPETTLADRGYVEGWERLGQILTALGRLTDAQDAYQRAIALAPNEPRLRAALTELPEAVLLAEWYNMIDGISRHYMLPAWWYQETIKRLAADDIRLVRSAKRDPREREQCLPDFWSSPHHDDVYRR